MANTLLKNETAPSDYLFCDLSDCRVVGKDLIELPEGKSSLAGMHVDDLPSALYGEKKATRLGSIRNDMWDEQGRVYLVGGSRAKRKDLQRLGVQYDDQGAYIERKGKAFIDMLTRYLPSMAHTPMLGELIPASSWGANLHRLVTDACWQRLRDETFSGCDDRCMICGAKGNLECHELWRYYEPVSPSPNQSAYGIQELERLMALCPQCHQAHHLGFANRQGKLEEALNWVGFINSWTSEELVAYYAYVTDTWQRRSRYGWALDLSRLPDPITLQSKWTISENLFVQAETAIGHVRTKLLGVQWSVTKDSEQYLTKMNTKRIRT